MDFVKPMAESLGDASHNRRNEGPSQGFSGSIYLRVEKCVSFPNVDQQPFKLLGTVSGAASRAPSAPSLVGLQGMWKLSSLEHEQKLGKVSYQT